MLSDSTGQHSISFIIERMISAGFKRTFQLTCAGTNLSKVISLMIVTHACLFPLQFGS